MWSVPAAILVDMRDPVLDLLLGSRCVLCSRPGRQLCRHCEGDLPAGGSAAWPQPAPDGLVLPYAAGPYSAPLKQLIIGHKERRQLVLAAPLGRVLAAVVTDLLATLSHDGPVVLLPVPSRAATVRSRGHDPTLRMARAAAAAMRAAGRRARVVPAVSSVGRAADQAGLSQAGRQANAQGRFRIGRGGIGALDRESGATVVIVDDIITTGNTLREVQGCLARGAIEPAGAAVVAATQRRANFEAQVPYRIL